MGQLISRFDKNKLLEPDDLITSGIACQLLYTHPKTLNEWVDTGIIPAVKAQQRTRWEGDSGKWRVFKVSHLLAHAVLKNQPVDESMLVKYTNPLQTTNQKYNRIFCYGYDYNVDLPRLFQRVTMRGLYRILELCPIVTIIIGPEVDTGRALGIAEELLIDFDPLDINIWRQYNPNDTDEEAFMESLDMVVFKRTFKSTNDVYDCFLTKLEADRANA